MLFLKTEASQIKRTVESFSKYYQKVLNVIESVFKDDEQNIFLLFVKELTDAHHTIKLELNKIMANKKANERNNKREQTQRKGGIKNLLLSRSLQLLNY